MLANTPVLLIAFSRPDTAQQVFNAIRKARPGKFYFSVDGPRPGREEDVQNCQATRDIIKQVDWDCQVFTNFPEKNLGCAVGVSSAITWAFTNEDRLIILEDDTVPALSFFPFCEELLEKYLHDTRICMISGNNYTPEANGTEDSYFFSYYGHIWGWATWKRAWDKFDLKMSDWRIFRDTNQIQNVFPGKKEQKYFTRFYDVFLINKYKGTWDYQWFYCRLKELGLSIIPKNNLVSNIGVQGTHTNSKSQVHFFPADEDFILKKEPAFLLRNVNYDLHHFKKIINPKRSLTGRFIKKIRKFTLKST